MHTAFIDTRIMSLRRRLGLDHNTLRRQTDRVESGATLAAIGVVFVSLPLTLGVGLTTYGQNMTAVADQHASRDHVSALVTGPPPVAVTNQGGATVFLAQAEWTTPDGLVHAGQIQVPVNTRPQSVVDIWTNKQGVQVDAPLTWESALGRAVLATCGSIAALGVLLWCLILIARWRLNRRRLLDWDIEWRYVGPQWTLPAT